MSSDPKTEFALDGYTAYSILSWEWEDVTSDRIEQGLPQFDVEASPPRSGVSDRELPEFNFSKNAWYRYLADEIHYNRYVSEEIGSQVKILTDENKIDQGRVINEISADIVWYSPERVLLRGGKASAEKLLDPVQRAANAKANFVSFDNWFLMWLLYKYTRGEDPEHFSIIELSGATVKGDHDSFGGQVSVKSAVDVTQSSPIIESVLNGKQIQSLMGTFEVEEHLFVMDIDAHGRVHIKADGDIRELSDLERLLVSAKMTDRVLQQYHQWQKVPQKRRYPPAEFFLDLRQILSNEGVETAFSIVPAIKEVAVLRGEDPDTVLTRLEEQYSI